jgi:hypothetical protein
MKRKVAQLIAAKQFEVIEEEIQPIKSKVKPLLYLIWVCMG